MGSIKDKVCIIGMGCTKFGEKWSNSANDMIVEATYEAFGDAGIEAKDIQAAWVGTAFGYTGMSIARPLKLQYLPITRVENVCATGSDAFRNASYAVAAGIYEIVLIVGYEKSKDTGYSGLPQGVSYPSHHVEPLTTAPGLFAIMATRYFARYGITPTKGKEMIGKISVKSHHNGSMNPKAHFQNRITLDQVLNAPIIAWPLGLFDCCGVSDGAAAAIISRADIAKELCSIPVYVKALQTCIGPAEGFMRTDYDYTHVEETFRAGRRAYEEAGISEPREEIRVAEVHDCFSITEAVTMEDLQLSPRGRVKEDIESGFYELAGGLPVQPDGGLKCFGHPMGASGLRMLYEIYKQLQGKAGPRQIKNVRLGLTHNLGGSPPASAVFVGIVGL